MCEDERYLNKYKTLYIGSEDILLYRSCTFGRIRNMFIWLAISSVVIRNMFIWLTISSVVIFPIVRTKMQIQNRVKGNTQKNLFT